MKRVALVCIAVACSVTSEPKSFGAPSDEDFSRVSVMLQARCGSLDCHGQPGRSLRLYGEPGLRLTTDDIPGGRQSSPAEHAANYASVLALEPEILSAVVRDGGRELERLTLVRKARNVEAHAGGRALDESADRCLASWLGGGPVDAQACFDGSVLQKPAGFDSGGAGGVGGSGGTGGTGASGGSAGAGATGGTGATGGSGGTGATGGAGGSGGVVCTPGGYWPCTYDAACKPLKTAPPDHDAYVQVECLSCHVAGGPAGPGQEFLFGGIAKNPYDGTGAPQIEVGVRDGALFYYACTDERGFFFVPAEGNPEPNWDNVETRMRALLGSKIMPDDKEHKPTCNEPDCHGHPEHPLLAPL